ncbi:MAG TPA: hypothetical protein VFQ61_28595, partial [Polyangiaceae bacterium]|nr:hypothetical protein [Polyangiaceae bacterium]
TLKGSLVLNGPGHASAQLSIASPIEFKTREDPLQFRLEAGLEVLKVEADAAQKSASLAANLGEISMNTGFGNFVSGIFGLSLKEGSPPQPGVDMTIPGLRGTLVFDGSRDVVSAQGLDLAGAPALAVQNGNTLLSLRTSDAQQGPIAATFSGLPDDTLELGLPAGLQVELQYGMEPVASLIKGPANYLARDTLKTTAAPNTTVRLFQETGWDNLALTGNQLGRLLRVSAGTIGMSSSIWPNDAVSAQADQCLTRQESSVGIAAENRHDLLSTLSVAACTP